MKMQPSQSSHRHDSAATKNRFRKTIGWLGALVVMLGAEVGLGALGIGTANAGCATASPPATVDCDGIQHGELSMSTINAADGHGGQVAEHGVEDYDGTQGEFCSAMAGSVPRC
jgi:hypothetical protein